MFVSLSPVETSGDTGGDSINLSYSKAFEPVWRQNSKVYVPLEIESFRDRPNLKALLKRLIVFLETVRKI
jgi:hypothetical protein